jgi:hypothetical protein
MGSKIYIRPKFWHSLQQSPRAPGKWGPLKKEYQNAKKIFSITWDVDKLFHGWDFILYLTVYVVLRDEYVDMLFKKFKWCDIIYTVRQNKIKFQPWKDQLIWSFGERYLDG